MITLADLAALQNSHGDAWASPVTPVVLTGPRGEVSIGDGRVTLMGCVNLWVAFNFPTSTWVNFKLFGGIGLMVIFIMGQAFFLNKHVKADTSPDVSP